MDGESSLNSADIRGWCRQHGIRLAQPLPHNSTAQGPVERGVWTFVEENLRCEASFPGDQRLYSRIAWSWNSTPRQSSHQLPPHLIQFGRPPLTLADRIASPPASHDVVPTSTDRPYHHTIAEILRTTAAVQALAATRGNAARRATAVRLNERSPRPLSPLSVGDTVYYYAPAHGNFCDNNGIGRNSQFVSPFAGPATIIDRISNVGYVVQNARGSNLYRHRRHLRRLPPTTAQQTTGTASTDVQPPPRLTPEELQLVRSFVSATSAHATAGDAASLASTLLASTGYHLPSGTAPGHGPRHAPARTRPLSNTGRR